MALPWADPLLCNAPTGMRLGITARHENPWPFLDLWMTDSALDLPNGVQCELHSIEKPALGRGIPTDPIQNKYHLDLCPHSAPKGGMFNVNGEELRNGMFSLSTPVPPPCSFCSSRLGYSIKQLCRNRFPLEVENRIGSFLSYEAARNEYLTFTSEP